MSEPFFTPVRQPWRRHVLRAVVGAALAGVTAVVGSAEILAQAPAPASAPAPAPVPVPSTAPASVSSPAPVPTPAAATAPAQPQVQSQGAATVAPQPAAEPQSGDERRVKAAFLYKFLGYTEFPSTAFGDHASPVQIGVSGSDDMLAELARTVAGRTLNGRPITVRAVREGDNPGLLHLLFVAGSDAARVARVLRGAPGALLLVSECDGGLQQGSVINFRVVDEHVRFDVSLDAAEKNNVRLSSRLLGVANHVQKGNI
jgi:hypothetical protein